MLSSVHNRRLVATAFGARCGATAPKSRAALRLGWRGAGRRVLGAQGSWDMALDFRRGLPSFSRLQVAVVTAFWVASLTLFLWSRFLTISDVLPGEDASYSDISASAVWRQRCRPMHVPRPVDLPLSLPVQHNTSSPLPSSLPWSMRPTSPCSPCAASPTTGTSRLGAASCSCSRSRWRASCWLASSPTRSCPPSTGRRRGFLSTASPTCE